MSLLHSTTTQYSSDPTDSDIKHTPHVKKISDHEIEVDIEMLLKGKYDQSHHMDYVCLYSIRRLVDTYYFKPGDKPTRVIFDLNKLNKKEAESSDVDENYIPRIWSIHDDYHVIAHCNIHGNWCDTTEDLM